MPPPTSAPPPLRERLRPDGRWHNGVLDPGVELIGKPFKVEELAAKLREVLEAPAARQAHIAFMPCEAQSRPALKVGIAGDALSKSEV